MSAHTPTYTNMFNLLESGIMICIKGQINCPCRVAIPSSMLTIKHSDQVIYDPGTEHKLLMIKGLTFPGKGFIWPSLNPSAPSTNKKQQDD